MRCTKCNKILRPVVAVDIDGTLADYHGHFLAFAGRYLGQDVLSERYDGAEGFKHWFCQVTGSDANTWNDIKLAYRQGAQKRSLPIYPGAKELIRRLHQHGAEIWLTTTRPHLRLDGIDPDTRAWLDRHGIKYDGLLYDDDKYAQLALRIDGDRMVGVLDDLPEQCEAADAVFGAGTAIGRLTCYNTMAAWTSVECVPIDRAREMLISRVLSWKVQHGSE